MIVGIVAAVLCVGLWGGVGGWGYRYIVEWSFVYIEDLVVKMRQ